ncbi:hypothetical protein [Bdellovibrio sp. BCCA]|uniref:hypothetical protein n=1 Tax=Bdellovibrio sp. BCCA TaxID=3136281 RepID=UPI0030F07AC4
MKKLLRMNAPDHIKKRLHHLVEKFSPIKEFFKITKRIFLEHGEAIIRGVLGVIIGAGYLTLRVLYLLFWPIHLFGAILSLRRAEKEYAKKSDHPAEE